MNCVYQCPDRLLKSNFIDFIVQVRINHMKHVVSFGTDLGVASQKEEMAEGPSLQAMPSEMVRQQLSHMALALEKVRNLRSTMEES